MTTPPDDVERAREADRARMPTWFIGCVGVGLFVLAASAPLVRATGARWIGEPLDLAALALLIAPQLILLRARRAKFGPARRLYPSPPSARVAVALFAVLAYVAITALTRQGMAIAAIALAAALAALLTGTVAYRNHTMCDAIRAGRFDGS